MAKSKTSYICQACGSVHSLWAGKCESCGEYTFGNESEEVIDTALRQTVGLLSPDQILQGRRALGLTQSQLAELLGCAQESISRWEGEVTPEILNANLRDAVALPPPG